MSLANMYLESVIKRFREYKNLGDKTFDQLDEAQMLAVPNEASNSIAVIIRHLHGNMLSRWTNFLTEDGEKVWRERDAEFENSPASKQELLELWEEGWKVLLDTIGSLQEEDLLRTITIRSQPLTVIDAINRQLVHYNGHIGQIIYIGRFLKKADWKTLSIPKGGSRAFNEKMEGKH